ncbi:hypothetical protein SCP_0212490 [Sparassis crispa]|uniref:GST N-terminal domain-containing protein n=1 Tax=Sparassis crispa TaxID=139825 RepID=A0A401GD08_9APHY|nr:hypothetical protein SCP_0212490 [Sparassis crispa]GBE80047.1 hypothetical protein SCP_0212490 [Sparassis crispa]
MATGKVLVVLYQYDASPFSTKVKDTLALKGIPHSRVDVAFMPPRPEISTLLGVSYRRIPVLAIGSDVYCDTGLIASALERRFPPSEGYYTLFPNRKGTKSSDVGLVKALSMYYAERVLLQLAADSFPFNQFPKAFVEDRNAFFSPTKPIDLTQMASRQPEVKSAISSHLTLVEEQLADGREWLLDTEAPGLADISFHFVFEWLQGPQFRALHDLLDAQKFPKSLAWLSNMTAYIDSRQKTGASAFENITGEQAAKLIGSSPCEDVSIVGFDNVEAAHLGVKLGEDVSIEPQDTGKIPTIGKLVALNREEAVIETRGTTGAVIRCHFPRLNFSIKKAHTKL